MQVRRKGRPRTTHRFKGSLSTGCSPELLAPLYHPLSLHLTHTLLPTHTTTTTTTTAARMPTSRCSSRRTC